MQRMSGIDPMFVYSDTPLTPMEVAYICVFDPASAPGGYSFEAVRAVLADRVPTLLPLRRRLMVIEDDGSWRMRVPLMQRWLRARG